MSPSAALELSCQTLRCVIAPDIGGCVAGLWLDEVAVLRATPSAELNSARQSGCFALLPFSNRIGHARLTWDGRTYPLHSSPGDEPPAIHGVGWQRPWRVLEASAQHARLAYEHLPDDSWPFAFAAVKEALEAAGFKAEVAEIIMKPATETVITGDNAVKMQKLLDALEALDDVQEVYSNTLIED